MSLAEAAFAVGMIGLVQFLPLFALTLIAGETADRHDRRRILTFCYLAQALVASSLALRSATGGGQWQIFALAGLFGCALRVLPADGERPRPHAGTASIAATGNCDQFTRGPACQHCRPGDRRPALHGVADPRLCRQCVPVRRRRCVCGFDSRDTRPYHKPSGSRVAQIREGLVYLWGNKLVLGAISLDLFAVLLGGATGLLPVFAHDVLEVGPRGFGMLRSSQAAGALIVAMYLARHPIRTQAGLKMFMAVGLFGLMTVVFAFSRSVPLSMFTLAVLGGADMVSVFTRQSLVQIATPDRMRGAYRPLPPCSSERPTNWANSKAASWRDSWDQSDRSHSAEQEPWPSR